MRLAALCLVALTTACEAPPSTQEASAGPEPKAPWPVPAGWMEETFALPPDFDPEFPFHGMEDLRFMPGFFSPAAADFWSYDFVWWVDEAPRFDAPTIAAALTSYFRGLCTAVGGQKYELDPSRYHAELALVPGTESPRLAGQVLTYDPFQTGLPVVLNVEVELRSCPGGRAAIVVALSPRAATDRVWEDLRATAASVACP